jgi:chromosome segregation ATPase
MLVSFIIATIPVETRESKHHYNHSLHLQTMNVDSNSMAALAARIQDRATQFISEQTKLQSLAAELEHTRAVEQNESDTNTSLRRDLLETTCSRHSIELEIYDAREKTNSHMQSIQTLEEETEKIKEETETVETKWENDIKNIYAPHQSKIELYTQAIEFARETRESKINEKRQRHEAVEERIQRLKDEEEHFRRQSRDLQMQITGLEKEELQGDAQVSSLATQVQSALSEVRNYRSLRGSSFRFGAHFDFLSLMNECMNPSIYLSISLSCSE